MNMRGSITSALVSGPAAGTDGAAVFEFRFPADAPVFAGHFPGHPLLPGVFQLELARIAAERVLNSPLAVREIGRAKFLRPVLPEETLRVEVQCVEKDGGIEARAKFSVNGQRAGEAFLLLGLNA